MHTRSGVSNHRHILPEDGSSSASQIELEAKRRQCHSPGNRRYRIIAVISPTHEQTSIGPRRAPDCGPRTYVCFHALTTAP